MVMTGVAMLALAACDRSPPTADETASPEQTAAASATVPAAATSTDAELEQLKTVTPMDACATLTPDKLKVVYPDLAFEVHQKIDPQISGYNWDSRCVYRAGVGTMDFARDTPTHTVEIFANTAATETKAQANLASRHETAATTSGYQAQTALGANAYTTAGTGMARLFFVKGRSEIQINVSDLKSPSAEQVSRLLALAQSL
jgi:hypothetical protein